MTRYALESKHTGSNLEILLIILKLGRNQKDLAHKAMQVKSSSLFLCKYVFFLT